jgi:exodeoxyribonuclease VII large subunit
VADLVANLYHKTPSALGSYIVDRARNFEVRFTSSFNYILEYKDKFLESRKSSLNLNIQTFSSKSISYTQLRRGELHTRMTRINTEIATLISIQKNKIGVSHEILRTTPQSLINSKLQQLGYTLQLVDINSKKHINNGLILLKNSVGLVVSMAQSKISEGCTYFQNVTSVLGMYHPENILQKGYGIPRKDGVLLSKQELHTNDTIELELSNRVLVLSFIKYKEKWKSSLMNLLRKN